MRRISVIGSSTGVGKTTFGRRLAERLSLQFVELDALFWGPRWTQASTEAFRADVAAALAGEGWVVDGNYTGRLGQLIWSQADTVVWLDLPFLVALWRTLVRTLRRVRTREELWSGNRESVRNAFLSRDSLIFYAIRTYRRRRRLFEERLASPNAAHLTVHRFRSDAEAERWLDPLATAPASTPRA